MSRFSHSPEPLSDLLAQRSASGNRTPVVPPKLLEAIESSARKQFEGLLTAMFATIDDLFYDLSSRASSNNEANLYFESMREIRVQKERLVSHSVRALTEGFALMLEGEILSNSETDPELNHSDLSIVQGDELEMDLAYRTMVSSAKIIHHNELYDLAARLDHLLMHLRVDDENNPLHPSYISLCFLNTCKEALKIDIKTKLIVLKQFEKHVLKQLGHIYAKANQTLREAGILPKVPRSLNAQNGSPYVSPETDETDDSQAPNANSQPSANASRSPQTSFDLGSASNLPPGSKAYIIRPNSAQNSFNMSSSQMRVMLSNLRQQSADLGAVSQTQTLTQPKIVLNVPQLGLPVNYTIYTSNPGPQMPANQLVHFLTKQQTARLHQTQPSHTQENHTQPHVQPAASASKPTNVISDVVQEALKENSPEEPQALDQKNEDIINLVALFFDQVIADNDIPSVIQSAICRLQIPILKVALKDRDFFSDYHHPARTFVNTVTHLGIGFDENKPLSRDPLYKKIVAAIDFINENYEDELDVFTQKQLELEKAIEKQHAKAEVVEQRTRQSEAGKAKFQQARSQAQDAIYRKIKDVSLPNDINHFLSSSWLQVLMIAHLRHGIESSEWLAAEQVITDLIWVCQPHEDSRSKSRRERILPALLEQINDSLVKAIESDNTSTALVGKLEEVVRGIIDNHITEDNFEPLQPEQKEELGRGEKDLKPWDELTAVERQQMRYDELSKHFFDAAKALTEDTWIDFIDDPEGHAIRCKLSAIIDADTYVFVNRLGFKTFNKTRKELAYDMQFKRALVVDDSPLFDKIMNKLVNSLSPA